MRQPHLAVRLTEMTAAQTATAVAADAAVVAMGLLRLPVAAAGTEVADMVTEAAEKGSVVDIRIAAGQ